jgi:hypothetical protein
MITEKADTTHRCEFCDREFRRESSLEVHMCEPKRRWRERRERGVELGLQAYLRFYETQQGSSRLRGWDDFEKSQYYRAFVKFGRHCVAIRAVSPVQFLDWLLKTNKKIDHWCRDSVYEEYLQWWLPREPAADALERGMCEIVNYTTTTTELRNGVADYFRYGNPNRVCYHISTGRVSPWIVYNCDSGVEFLDTLTVDHTAMIMNWIDPDTWQRKFQDFPADQQWCRHMLTTAGL